MCSPWKNPLSSASPAVSPTTCRLLELPLKEVVFGPIHTAKLDADPFTTLRPPIQCDSIRRLPISKCAHGYLNLYSDIFAVLMTVTAQVLVHTEF